MNKIIMMAIFTFFLNANLMAQRDIVVFANNNDFLLPFIKTTLEEMVDSGTRKKNFSNVTILNTLTVSSNADGILRNELKQNFPDKEFSSKLSKQDTTILSNIFKLFTENDYYLLVNENTLQDKIEFQFMLYEIIKPIDQPLNVSSKTKSLKTEYRFPFKNILNPIAQNNFFINLNSQEYINVLRNGVKRLILSSNFPTRFKVAITGNTKSLSNSQIMAAKDDAFYLNISDIYDEDSPLDKIDFGVQIFSDISYSEKPFSVLKLEDYKYSLKFSNTGKYKILVSANDGTLVTRNDTILVTVLALPKIYSLINKIEILTIGIDGGKKSDFVIPVFVESKDSMDFQLEFNGFQKTKRNIILDNLRKKRSGSFKLMDSMALFPKVSYKMDSDSVYIIRVKSRENSIDSSISVFGVANGLKTNIENINIKRIDIFGVSLSTGMEFNNLDIKPVNKITGDSTVTVKYTTLNLLQCQMTPFSFKDKLSLSVSVAFKKMILNRTDDPDFYNKNLEPQNSFSAGIGANFHDRMPKYLVNANISFLYYTLPVKAINLGPNSSTTGIGFTFGMGLSSLKFNGLGLSNNFTYVFGKDISFKYSQGGWGISLSYLFIQKK